MKKFLLILAVAFLAVGSVVSQASAFSLGGYTGEVQIKFYDWTIGRQYTLNNGVWTPEGARAGLLGGAQSLTNGVIGTPDGISDSWSILNVTTITDNDGNPLWSGSPTTEQITGHMYGFDDIWLSSTLTGIDVGLTNGFLELYLDNMSAGGTAFSALDSPYTHVEPPVGGGGDAWNVTDGILFLKLRAVTGIIPSQPTISLYENVNGLTAPFSGSGSVYWEVVGGAYQDMFNTNGFLGGAADMYSIFNFNGIGQNSFDSKSSDPTYANVVPEPSSILLLGFGLLGLVGWARRRTER